MIFRIKPALLILVVFSINFFSCVSFQEDIIMSTDSAVQTEDVLRIEQEISVLDAAAISSGGFSSWKMPDSELSSITKQIEAAVASAGLNHALTARLYALEGLTYFLSGNKSSAKNFYRKAQETFRGDAQAIVLASRLGIIKDLKDKNVVSEAASNPLIELERGLQDFLTGKYANCIARLDSSFTKLPDFYRESYASVRETAWALRNTQAASDDKKIVSLLAKKTITVSDMILITQDTTELLSSFTGGKKLSEGELYKKLDSARLFESTSESATKDSSVKKTTSVTRSLAARFLWNIFCFRKNLNPEQKTRYSRVFASSNRRSPIEDVLPSDADFDAVLGTVENEIIPLADGRRFIPDEKPSAAEYHVWAGKVK